MSKSRDEHLAWCKQRALEILERGDISGAWASFVSDMGKHPETKGHIAIELGNQLLFNRLLGTKEAMKHHIEGFN